MLKLYFAFVLFLIFVLFLFKVLRVKSLLIYKLLIILTIILLFFCGTLIYGHFIRTRNSSISQNFISNVKNRYNVTPLNSGQIAQGYSQLPLAFKGISPFPTTINNKVDLLQNGNETYNALYQELSDAKSHIHIEDFIFRDDSSSKMFQDLLIKKAKQGVKVRLLVDGYGMKINKESLKKMKAAGIQVKIYNSIITSFFNGNINNRDHRKIYIIDGITAFTGGINIGDEYLGKDPQRGFWRDIDIKVTGDSVKQLQTLFLSSWYIATGESLAGDIYFPAVENKGNLAVQVIDGDPNLQISPIEVLYTNLINTAKQSISIETPYLVLDDKMYNNLVLSASKGIDVKIIIPSRPDDVKVYTSTMYYAKKLIERGIKLYKFNNGFVHSKLIIIDGKIVSIGTANLNNRSLHLDYEDCVLIYDERIAQSVYNDFLKDMLNSKSIALSDYSNMSFFNKIYEKTAVFFSPLE